MLETLIIIVHLLVALGLVGLILIQHGKGADAGASFGAGASATVFGSQGSATFLSRVTAILAAIFFATSLGLAYYAKQQSQEMQTLGLPDPAVIEETREAPVEDVPVLQEQQAPVDGSADVPAVPSSDPASVSDDAETDAVTAESAPAVEEIQNIQEQSAPAQSGEDVPTAPEQAPDQQ